MQRVQDALKGQLTRQNEKLEIELREAVSTKLLLDEIMHCNLGTHLAIDRFKH